MSKTNNMQTIKVEDGIVYRKSDFIRRCLKVGAVLIVFAGFALIISAKTNFDTNNVLMGLLTLIGGGLLSYGGFFLWIHVHFTDFGYLWVKEKPEGVPVNRYTSSTN